MTCCFMGYLLVALICPIALDKRAFGEECARGFEKAKSPQHDPTATAVGTLRHDQDASNLRQEWCKKLELQEVQGAVTEQGHDRQSSQENLTTGTALTVQERWILDEPTLLRTPKCHHDVQETTPRYPSTSAARRAQPHTGQRREG